MGTSDNYRQCAKLFQEFIAVKCKPWFKLQPGYLIKFVLDLRYSRLSNALIGGDSKCTAALLKMFLARSLVGRNFGWGVGQPVNEQL